ncbi:MAG: hypothetical protein ACJZZ8_02360 [Candidatus Neomarinimicrobiota bacterium]
MRRIIAITIFAILIPFSVAQKRGSFAGGFLRMGTSARAVAMGSAFTAEIDKGFAAYYNPASIVHLKNSQAGFSNHFLMLDRQLMTVNISMPLPPSAAVGISWIGAGVDNIDGRNTAGQHTKNLSTSENAYMVSFAQTVLPWLSLGLNVKVLRHQLPVNSMDLTGKGVGMDFGIFVKTKSGANLALMIQDLNSRYQWKTDKIFERGKVYIEQFPTLYRVGTTFDYSNVYITADAGIVMNGSELIGYTARVGAEYKYLDHYYLRGGFGNGRVGVGLGLDWSLFDDMDSRLDYAFTLEGAAGISHVFTYAFSF